MIAIEVLRPISEMLNAIPTISPSQYGMWLDCRQKHKYSYKDKLVRRSSSTLAMDKGSYFHKLSHYYYHLMAAGFKPGNPLLMESMNAKIQRDLQEMSAETVEILAIASNFKAWMQNQSPIIDQGIRVLAVEKEVFVLFISPNGKPFFLHGIIDLVYLRNGKIRIRDHKTGSQNGTWSNEALELEPQMFFYNLAVHYLFSQPIEGIETNFINVREYKTKDTSRVSPFQMFYGRHSDKALMNFKEELLSVADEILDGKVYRRYNKSCEGCTYFKLCVLEIKGLPTTGTIATEFERKKSRDGQNSTVESTSPVIQSVERQPERTNPVIEGSGFKLSRRIRINA